MKFKACPTITNVNFGQQLKHIRFDFVSKHDIKFNKINLLNSLQIGLIVFTTLANFNVRYRGTGQ